MREPKPPPEEPDVEVVLVVLLVDGAVWVDEVVLDVVLLEVVVEEVVLDVVLLEVELELVVLDVLLDEEDVVLLTAAVYVNVVIPTALVPSPPQVAFTEYVPEIQLTVPPATMTPVNAPEVGSTGSS